MPGLDVDDVMSAAVAQAGSDDFGPDAFVEGLTVLCASANDEAQLSELGEFALQQNVIGGLVNRLRIHDWVRRHPAPGRAHRCAADRRRHVPGGYDVPQPAARPGSRQPGAAALGSGRQRSPSVPGDVPVGARVDAANEAIDMLESLDPQMKIVHHEDAEGTTECITLLSQDFKSLTWEAMANVPAYSDWLMGADYRSAYDYHHTVLRVLQSGGRRGAWTLKSPNHAIALNAVNGVYPDARLVLLHRDPTVLCASACSLISTLTGTFSDADRTAYIAEHWTQMLATSIERTEAFRREHPEQPIIDVQYADLVGDPLGTVETLYAACGREFDDRARTAVSAYVAANPKGRFGTHGYRLEDYGLQADELRERFADYVKRYDIASEVSTG